MQLVHAKKVRTQKHLVLPSLTNVREPLGSFCTGNQDDVRNVTWSEATAYCQMNPL
jgi:hypothetical protein